jgi:hypothetical protein
MYWNFDLHTMHVNPTSGGQLEDHKGLVHETVYNDMAYYSLHCTCLRVYTALAP